MTDVADCQECNGTGKCPHCTGKGWTQAGSCSRCGGSGRTWLLFRCKRCSGSGELRSLCLQCAPEVSSFARTLGTGRCAGCQGTGAEKTTTEVPKRFDGRCPICDRSEIEGFTKCKYCGRQLAPTRQTVQARLQREKHPFPSSGCDLCGRQVAEPSGGTVLIRSPSNGSILGFLESRRYLCSVCRVTICLPCLTAEETCPKCGSKAKYG